MAFFRFTNTFANLISNTDGKFTLIGLTAASGDDVMCIIIFAGEELTFEQKMGHGIRVEMNVS